MKATERALYRGKCIETGEWVEGFLFIDEKTGRAYIKRGDTGRFGCGLEVDPETVGQWTGLTDKNGTKIFEGDWINVNDGFFEGEYEVKWYSQNDYPAFDLEGWESESNGLSEAIGAYSVKVIGNIHDK